MKSIIIGIALAMTILAGCNGTNNKSAENKKMDVSSKRKNNSTSKNSSAVNDTKTPVTTEM